MHTCEQSQSRSNGGAHPQWAHPQSCYNMYQSTSCKSATGIKSVLNPFSMPAHAIVSLVGGPMQAEEKRLRLESKGLTWKQPPKGGRKKRAASAAGTVKQAPPAASNGAAATSLA